MSSEFDDILEELSSPGQRGSDTRAMKVPESWRPRMEIDESGGFLVSTPRNAAETPDMVDILAEFDLDPTAWSVTSVRRSKWQTYGGDWLQSFRVSVTPQNAAPRPDFDLEKMLNDISKWRPNAKIKRCAGENAFILAPSDQQIGKKQGEENTGHSINRILNGTEEALTRFLELQKIGRNMGTVVLALPGDHVEGITSQNGRLQGQAASDLGMTEQVRVARRLLLAQVKAFAPHCERMIVPVVNGNHDEVTRQVAADPADGWNVEIASSVQDICAENDALSHVEFRYPDKDHQTLAVDINGVMLGLFHGHQAGKDVLKFLSGHAAGQTPLGGCDLWISGHYHNFKCMDIGHRLWIQAPTTDPGSAWFRDRTGIDSPTGILTLVVGPDHDARRDISIVSVTSRK